MTWVLHRRVPTHPVCPPQAEKFFWAYIYYEIREKYYFFEHTQGTLDLSCFGSHRHTVGCINNSFNSGNTSYHSLREHKLYLPICLRTHKLHLFISLRTHELYSLISLRTHKLLLLIPLRTHTSYIYLYHLGHTSYIYLYHLGHTSYCSYHPDLDKCYYI